MVEAVVVVVDVEFEVVGGMDEVEVDEVGAGTVVGTAVEDGAPEAGAVTPLEGAAPPLGP